MKQSPEPADSPLHVALIMDGNGRWATAGGLPRVAGHRAGSRVVRRLVEAAPGLGIGTLTLYAFSSDNWSRPAREVRTLMRLLRDHLLAERERCVENGVRVRAVGRRDRLPRPVVEALHATETATAGGRMLDLRLAIDYSARDLLARAAALAEPGCDRARFAGCLATVMHESGPAKDVDLLIRTGGEQRLSDFLLWECAYAELWFTRTMWPDFGVEELAAAIEDFRRRERRYGGLSERAAS